MTGDVILLPSIKSNEHLNNDQRLDLLVKQLMIISFFNLFLVACLGLLLRMLPFMNGFPLLFKNILHGHSHFAFGGWLMPVILALLIRYFPELRNYISFNHWRNISIIFLVSAYGMLFTFPFTGYALFSVVFSSISILGGFYLSVMSWKAITASPKKISLLFLSWAFVYFVISSIGPFTTGPLIVMGYKGEPIYFNAIYFYLHFQYNGWFAFIVLALFYRMLESKKIRTNGKNVLFLLNITTLPAFFLSVLWMKPSWIFYVIGGIGAGIQLVSIFWLMKDLKKINWKWKGVEKLFILAMSIFILKMILQFFSAFPLVAEIAFTYRNFIISYLHLVLLGSISLFLMGVVLKSQELLLAGKLKTGMKLFFFSFITTELILLSQATLAWLGIVLPNYQEGLFFFSVFFPVGFWIILSEIRSQISLHPSLSLK